MIIQDGRYFLEKGEQCENCEYFFSGKCPLIQVFASGFLDNAEPFFIDNCEVFKKYERHLKVVED